MLKKIKASWWVEVLFLALISALTYLPDVLSLGYYRDDWYYMYDGLVAGPRIFEIMFLHLRPARGPFFAALFSLFGTSPLPYHLLLYLWRFLGGLGMLWTFSLLWPKQRSARFFAALIFTIYPGFLWWVAGVEYQPMVFSLGAHVFSIALTLKVVQTENNQNKIIWFALSMLTGWYALALVDYAIGMEAFRWMALYVLVNRQSKDGSIRRKIIETFKLAAPVLLVPLGYLAWRLLFFENWRKATDIGLQLGAIFGSLNDIFWRLIYFIQSVLNVSVFAWGMPFGQIFYGNRLRDMLIGLIITAIGLTLTLVAERFFSRRQEDQQTAGPWIPEAIWLGLFGTCVGVLPIVLGNRTVSLSRFSHYALPASIAAVLLVTGLVYSLKNKLARTVVISLLVSLAMLTHHGLSTQARSEEATINDFWWQMSWRAPDIQTGTLLAVAFPFDYSDDADIVYGPANFIYYPEKQSQTPIKLAINAVAVQGGTFQEILLGKEERTVNFFDAHEYYLDYGNVLIVSQPAANSCMHVFDPRWTGFSVNDRDWVLASASKSRIEDIVLSGSPHLPPLKIFGPEPEHNWCYYYQKADLARQAGDWERVASLYAEARDLNLTANDQVEYMPFLQAFAYLGDERSIKQISSIINAVDWYQLQACQAVRSMAEGGYTLKPEIVSLTDELFCGIAQ